MALFFNAGLTTVWMCSARSAANRSASVRGVSGTGECWSNVLIAWPAGVPPGSRVLRALYPSSVKFFITRAIRVVFPEPSIPSKPTKRPECSTFFALPFVMGVTILGLT